MNEMKPEDVKRALECCDKGSRCFCDCDNCPYYGCDVPCKDKLHNDAIALLREKDAEIERLTVNMNAYGLTAKNLAKEFEDYRADVQMEIADARAEAIDEVKLRLSMHFGTYTAKDMTPIKELFCLIDRIAKEMKGN